MSEVGFRGKLRHICLNSMTTLKIALNIVKKKLNEASPYKHGQRSSTEGFWLTLFLTMPEYNAMSIQLIWDDDFTVIFNPSEMFSHQVKLS